MHVEPAEVPDYWDPTAGLGDAAEAAAPAADTSWADADAAAPDGYAGWNSIRGTHNVAPAAPAPPPEQELGETPAEFELRRQAEAETARRTAQHEAEAAQQARDDQAAAGDATSILLAKLQSRGTPSNGRGSYTRRPASAVAKSSS